MKSFVGCYMKFYEKKAYSLFETLNIAFLKFLREKFHSHCNFLKRSLQKQQADLLWPLCIWFQSWNWNRNKYCTSSSGSLPVGVRSVTELKRI